MTIRRFLILLFVILVSPCRFVKAQQPVITVTHFRDSALASSWCPYDSSLVAYNLLTPSGYYQIYTARVSPANTFVSEQCLTCSDTSLPGKNVAQPIFHPKGKYMLFTAEKKVHPGSSNNAIPGIGVYNDLYLMTLDGSKTYKLINMPDTGVSAIIETYFSPDGNEIMWDEMTDNVGISGKQLFGYWVVKIAPFIDDTVNGPHIDSSRIRTLMPGGVPAFNEPYGWSPDGSRILFASDYNQFWVWDDQIYTMDTLGNDIRQMSSTAHDYPYTEHGFYSSDGKYIVWMTNEGCNTGSSVGGDDWWIMNADSTHQQRLTYFNDTTCSYWTGSVHINCHGSFCPNRYKFIGDVTGSKPVQTNPDSSIGAAYIVSLDYLATPVREIKAPLSNYMVYPNPATNNVTVILPANTKETPYNVTDITGRQLLSGTMNSELNHVDISKLSNSLYLLEIGNENKRCFRIVKASE